MTTMSSMCQVSKVEAVAQMAVVEEEGVAADREGCRGRGGFLLVAWVGRCV